MNLYSLFFSVGIIAIFANGVHAQQDPNLALGSKLGFKATDWASVAIKYDSMGQLQAALSACNKAISMDPRCAPAYYARGLAFGDLKQRQKAVEDYSKAISLGASRELANAYRNRGIAYEQLGEHQKAIDDCTEAIKVDANNFTSYIAVSVALEKLGQHQKAIDTCNQIIRMHPECGWAYAVRAQAYQQIGKSDLASQDRAKAKQTGYVRTQWDLSD